MTRQSPVIGRLGRRLRRHARDQPDARAVWAAERWWSYRELVDAATALAGELALAPGDVCAVAFARGIEPVLAVCAAALAGAVPAMIDPGDPELAARAVARLCPAAVVAAPAEPDGGLVGASALTVEGTAAVLVRAGAPPWQPIARPGLALVIFTSGSTADGKGVAWSEARLGHDWTSTPATPLQRAGPGGVAVPLASALGIQDVMRSLHHGLATVLLAVPFRVGLEQARALAVNRMRLTPTHVDLLLASDVALPALRSCAVAAAPIKKARLRELAARLPNARVGRSYGLTESGAATAVWLDHTPSRMHTVGRAVGFRRVTVRDPDGRVLPPRTWGEVVIDLPMWDAGDGYLDAPPELARRFANAQLWTGDRGKLDGRGFLVLGARAAEILKVGGRSVSARRIEEALRGAAGGGELAVVGVPDRALGEVPCAVYTPACRPAELAAAATAAVRADEVPRWLLPRHALPRAGTGKLRRGVLATEAARWTSAFVQHVAPDHRSYPAYALDPRAAIVDGGVAPWFVPAGANVVAAAGRAIALVARRPVVTVLAIAYLQAGARGAAACRFVAGPFAVDGEVAGELLDVFAGELIRLVALLPGARVKAVYARSPRAATFAASGFAARDDGWLVRGDGVAPAPVLAELAGVADAWALLAGHRAG